MKQDELNAQNGTNGHRATALNLGGPDQRLAPLPNGQFLLLEAESDEALLLPTERRAKIFTAAQAQKIAERLDPILTLIACRLPVKEVARKAHVSNHTVAALIQLYAGPIAADMERYAGWTAEVSAGFLALAVQKASDDLDEIPFKDLVAAHSFTGKLSLDMRLASAQLTIGTGELNPAEDSTAVTERRQKFLDTLKQMATEAEEVKP